MEYNNYFKKITTINLVSFFTVMILEKRILNHAFDFSQV